MGLTRRLLPVVTTGGVRYIGQIKAPDDGSYTFSLQDLSFGDSARLWINGTPVMDATGTGEPHIYGDFSQPITLEAGQKYNLQLDFVEQTADAKVRLLWERDGGSAIPITKWPNYPTMPPGILLVNESPAPVLVGKSSSAAAMLSQHFYDDYERVKVTVRNRTPQEYGNFLRTPAGAQGDEMWSGTFGKNAVLGKDHYLRLEQQSYAQMFPDGLPERDQLYGTHLVVEYELLDENGNPALYNDTFPLKFNDNFYAYRWIDAVGEGEIIGGNSDAMAWFHEKTDKGLGKFTAEKEVDLFLPTSIQTTFEGTNPDFEYEIIDGGSKALFKYVGDLPFVVEDGEEDAVKDFVAIVANGQIPAGQIVAQGNPPAVTSLTELAVGGSSNVPSSVRSLGRTDDDSSVLVELGFELHIFGETYDRMYVNNNGNVSFGQPLSLWTPYESPDGIPEFPDGIPMIAPFWSDVDTRSDDSGEVKITQGISGAGNPYVLVEWLDVGYFGGREDTKNNNFGLYIENISHNSNVVVLDYHNMQWTTGNQSRQGGSNGFGGSGALIGYWWEHPTLA